MFEKTKTKPNQFRANSTPDVFAIKAPKQAKRSKSPKGHSPRANNNNNNNNNAPKQFGFTAGNIKIIPYLFVRVFFFWIVLLVCHFFFVCVCVCVCVLCFGGGWLP